MPQVPSTRWCPTPEQLMILEEMYRSGVRTPNAAQIQQITSHLSFYGKIEGKNVFYWFQNHKARDRQKLRRRLSRQHASLFQSSEEEENRASPLYNPPHLFFPQFFHQEQRQVMDLLRKIEDGGDRSGASLVVHHGYEWMATITEPFGESRSCHGLKTLELFPTRSTGLKEESSTSFKSSSCSVSTN